MNEAFWIQFGMALLTSVLSFFGSHVGATNAINASVNTAATVAAANTTSKS